jgi:ubiquinone biosynthesis protein UbiJ
VARRLDGQAVELEVDEVALGVASLAAGGDVGTAGLLDGDGDCWWRLLVGIDSLVW